MKKKPTTVFVVSRFNSICSPLEIFFKQAKNLLVLKHIQWE